MQKSSIFHHTTAQSRRAQLWTQLVSGQPDICTVYSVLCTPAFFGTGTAWL